MHLVFYTCILIWVLPATVGDIIFGTECTLHQTMCCYTSISLPSLFRCQQTDSIFIFRKPISLKRTPSPTKKHMLIHLPHNFFLILAGFVVLHLLQKALSFLSQGLILPALLLHLLQIFSYLTKFTISVPKRQIVMDSVYCHKPRNLFVHYSSPSL